MRRLLILGSLLSPLWAWANTADFTATTVCAGNNTLLISISTASVGQSIIAWDWDLNEDGLFDDAIGPNLSHQFSGAGTYNVGLRITTNTNAQVSIYKLVTVNALPLAQFTAAPACEGSPIMLTDASTGATISSVLWDLDMDGQYDDASGSTVPYDPGVAGTYPVAMRVVSNFGCAGVISGTVTLSPNPTVSFTVAGQCLGDVTTLSANAQVSSGNIASFDWELNGDNLFNDANTQIVQQQFIAAGNYQIGVMATTDMGCTASTTNLMVIAPLPVALFTHETACINQPVQFTNLSINQVGTASYVWDFGPFGTSTIDQPTPQFNLSGPLTVTLTITSSFGCVDDFVQSVNVLPAPVAAYTVNGICNGGESVFNNQTQANGSQIAGYFWDFGDLFSSVSFNPVHTYPDAGTWNSMLVVTSTDGCRDTAFQTVSVFPLAYPQISANGPLSFCDGGEVTLSVNAQAGESILWSNTATTPSTTISQSGTYTVLLVTSNGCEGRAEAQVTVFAPSAVVAGPDTSISIGNSVTLFATGGTSYEWSPQEGLNNPYSANPTATPTTSTVYTVTVTDANGCQNQGQVNISLRKDFDLEAVNLFTPNGDGKNDRFFIRNIEFYGECTLKVFNRWGNEVYTASPYLNDWTGTQNGSPLPEATYYYTLECPGFDGERMDGAVTILRANK